MRLAFPYRRWCLMLLLSGTLAAQNVTVTANVVLMTSKRSRSRDSSNVVVWLTPVGAAAPSADKHLSHPRLVQRNKSFEPHVLVIPVGTAVEFPNRDPFFHNVFSLFEGKRFDLGLYEAGTTREVMFDKPGISYIFCNIHAEMSAVVVALSTPYYAVSDRHGQVTIADVPPGRYVMKVWYENGLSETLSSLTREVTVSESVSSLGTLRLPATAAAQSHQNMYGRDYVPPAPGSPAYER